MERSVKKELTPREQQLRFIKSQIKDTLVISGEFGEFSINSEQFSRENYNKADLKTLFQSLKTGDTNSQRELFPQTRAYFNNLGGLLVSMSNDIEKHKINKQEIRGIFLDVVFELLGKKNIETLAENEKKTLNRDSKVKNVKERIRNQILNTYKESDEKADLENHNSRNDEIGRIIHNREMQRHNDRQKYKLKLTVRCVFLFLVLKYLGQDQIANVTLICGGFTLVDYCINGIFFRDRNIQIPPQINDNNIQPNLNDIRDPFGNPDIHNLDHAHNPN